MSKDWKAPKKLDSFKGVHPRMFLTKNRIDTLKLKIQSSHQHIWDNIQKTADNYTKRSLNFNYRKQGDMRQAGRGIPWQALAYLLTDNPVYLESAKNWVLTISKYPSWETNKSLAAGECLFGVAIGYDWLYDDFTPAERKLIREKLTSQARLLVSGPPQHYNRWLANHNHVEHVGLAAAGFALYDEVVEAYDWIRLADLVFDTFSITASNDGTSSEGHQYWAYTTESVLRYIELARELLGKNYYTCEWLENVPNFIIFSTTPDFNDSSSVMYFGDAHRRYDSHGVVPILYRTADEYNNGYAQWLAIEMNKRGIGKKAFCGWLELLWYNEKLASIPVTQLPTFRHFEDVGWITTRSGWDDDAVMIGFKNGPIHGHKIQPYYDMQYEQKWQKFHQISGGHGHPDVNSFRIYAYGEWLVIDPEYESPKWTKTHSTILVNGSGQIGAGKTWFDLMPAIKNNASSEIIKATSRPDFDYIIGDAGNIYPDSAGLEKFYRHLLYLKPNALFIVDELKADKMSDFEWRLNTEGKIEKIDNKKFVIKNNDVVLDVQILYPQNVSSEIQDQIIQVVPDKCKETLIIASLCPRKVKEIPAKILLNKVQGNNISFTFDNNKNQREINFELKNQTIQIIPEKKH